VVIVRNLEETFGKTKGKEWFRIYKREDMPSSIDEQIKRLKNAHFKATKCLWTKNNLAIIIANK